MSVSLECHLEAAPSAGRAGVRFALRNTGDRAVAVLDWHTPLEGILGRIFDVQRDGHSVPYQGPLVKRGDPEAEEYLILAPGESAEETVDLALAWTLPPGRYEVRFPGPLLDVTEPESIPRPRDRHQTQPLSCGPLRLDVS